MTFRNRLPILLVALLILAFPVMGSAQNITGTIVGTVKDGSGAALPNATVTLTNAATNAEVVVKTDDRGDFTAPSLQPGLYNVKTEATGFKQNAMDSVRLLANRTVRLEIALEPGEITQRVEVQATAPVINSESATIGNILESRVITALPLNGRTLDRLIRISAGVTTDSASNPRVAGSAYWGGIHFNVDGVTYNDSGNGGAAYSFRNGAATLPSIDPALGRGSAEYQHHEPRRHRRLRRVPARQAIHQSIHRL